MNRPLTRPPLRSATLSPLGRGSRQARRFPLLPSGEKVAAKRPDEGACPMRCVDHRSAAAARNGVAVEQAEVALDMG